MVMNLFRLDEKERTASHNQQGSPFPFGLQDHHITMRSFDRRLMNDGCKVLQQLIALATLLYVHSISLSSKSLCRVTEESRLSSYEGGCPLECHLISGRLRSPHACSGGSLSAALDFELDDFRLNSDNNVVDSCSLLHLITEN